MIYSNTVEAVFIERPNRFIAFVELNGKTETVHVKYSLNLVKYSVNVSKST